MLSYEAMDAQIFYLQVSRKLIAAYDEQLALAAHAHIGVLSLHALRLRISCAVKMGVYKYIHYSTGKIVRLVVLDASDFRVGDFENESVIHQVLFTLFRFVEI